MRILNDVFVSMELIQTSVKKREGKKWKQRWAVLRKDSLKSCQEVYYYLFFYKDAAHAKEGKEKNTLPLIDFCGLDFCRHYDREENILVLVTSSQTVYLSFELLNVRDHWKQTLITHLGEAVTYKICIPDKQRLKAGDATIRLYATFVSIITSNNYKCLNRWYMDDIQRYSAVDSNHFMFEITSSLKTKGGNVINLLVNENADDISKAFDTVASEIRNKQPCTITRHGSAMLDELDQARRNVGDQSFFRRAILRASERMRKKKRRPTAYPASKKTACNNTRRQQINPEVSLDLDTGDPPKTTQIISQRSSMDDIDGPDETLSDSPPPDLPRKRSIQHNDPHIIPDHIVLEAGSSRQDNLRPLVISASVDPTLVENVEPSTTPTDVNNDDDVVLDSGNNFDETDGHEDMLHGINLTSVETDKSDLSARNTRRSVDSFLSYKHPARYAIAKTKGTNSKMKNEKTPTPPPRSPVSLGLTPGVTPSVFQFPPVEGIENSIDPIDDDAFESPSNVPPPYSESTILNNNVKEAQEVCVLQDILPPGTKMINDSITSWTSYDSDLTQKNDAYENLPKLKNELCGGDYAGGDITPGRNEQRQNYESDPLFFESWAKATGDGKIAPSPTVTPQTYPDYVNIKSPQSDEDNSYVNVPQCNVNLIDLKSKKNKPKPPRLKSPRNEFEKYDDDDSSIYHAVGALKDGSYENVNGVRSANRNGNYLNVNKHVSPVNSKLNYIELGLPDSSHNKTTSCTSPQQQQQGAPGYNKYDYTWIDADATGAINRSMVEHRQQRDNPANRTTPTRFSR